MYKNNRLKQIQSFLELHGSVDISALSRELGVSEMTIRRDLSILVSRGTAVRTHGGAILPRERYLGDVYMDSRSQINVAEKKAIAKAAIAELQPGDSVYIDDGSTVADMTQFIPHNIQLRVTTTSMSAALEFNKFPNIDVIAIGGRVSKTTKSAAGPIALELLQSMYFKTAFIGVPYITVDGIITSNAIDEIHLKKAAIAQSQRSILLMDSSKIHKEPINIKLASLDDFQMVITDSRADSNFLANCMEKKIQVNIVEP